ncbi:beta-ketoacyl synthase [Mucilaginibacter daejeonensis]|uniref:beta-ketoacyl-[acyl-carrier-protein] synthase family protein n=1 Tax=Mucilaginibacter daejeonensis TaxID=398049 RepID=UPI001D1791F3|nr:beta-ketoacyl synthase N-terminal-like domain-containing protein [Mucilaginibacter daejeonensis]UEG52765.1 beta-ketoacyl synthase [Mucilaginibacter daejeonensis]
MSNETPNAYVVAHNIYTPLGRTTIDNVEALKAGKSGVERRVDETLSATPIYASMFDQDEHFINDTSNTYTRFERLLIASVQDTLSRTDIDVAAPDTIFIVSSTKGNIGLLETEEHTPELNTRISLATSAQLVASYFGGTVAPIVVSNACISGVLAIVTAMRSLRAGKYQNVIVTGADLVSRFVASGFSSFKALSDGVCRPFDRDRTGLNLGEGAGTIILSSNDRYQGNFKVLGGGISNDANHISGPSRTGQELAHAITQAMADAGKRSEDIGMISAHGTATPYNDEMEAAAITLAGLSQVPLNSLKANYGHTLGAAGLIESIASLEAIQQGVILPTVGYEHLGVTHPVKVSAHTETLQADTFLKTASGFGGCNGAVIFGK